jgi:hypothetical protein
MTVSWFLEALAREPLPQRIERETRPVLRLLRSVELPRVWVLGQKKAGTSLAANFVSQGVYGCDAAIDLPVRRWLLRWLLPYLFRRNPALAVEAIARIQRKPVVKEPNLCYYARALCAELDGRAAVVYVTRERPQHVRSILDRVLERRTSGLHVRGDLNFVWRDYIGGRAPGDALDESALRSLIALLSTHVERTEAACLDAVAGMRGAALVICYEDILAHGASTQTHRGLAAHWPAFDWDRARRTLDAQHQPRGARLVETALIDDVLAASKRCGA